MTRDLSTPEKTIGKRTFRPKAYAYVHRVVVAERSPNIRLLVQCRVGNLKACSVEVAAGFFRDASSDRCVNVEGIVGLDATTTMPDGTLFCNTRVTPKTNDEYYSAIELRLSRQLIEEALSRQYSSCNDAIKVCCGVGIFHGGKQLSPGLKLWCVCQDYRLPKTSLIVADDIESPLLPKSWLDIFGGGR